MDKQKTVIHLLGQIHFISLIFMQQKELYLTFMKKALGVTYVYIDTYICIHRDEIE